MRQQQERKHYCTKKWAGALAPRRGFPTWPSLEAFDILTAGRRYIWARVHPLRPSRNQYTGHWEREELRKIAKEGQWQIHITPGVVPFGASPRRTTVIAVAWLPVDLDRERGAPDLYITVLRELHRLGLPPPHLAYRTRHEGWHLWWKIRRVYLGPEDAPWRSFFVGFWERIQAGLVQALKHLGADPQAKGLHHQFCVYPVGDTYFTGGPPVTLGAFYRKLVCASVQLPRPRRWSRGGFSLPHSGREAAKALRWFDQQVFSKGKRNQGFLAWLIVRGWSGTFPTQEEALDWISSHSDPPYPQNEAWWVWKTAHRAFCGDPPQPYGISAQKLRDIGMPEHLIAEAVALMRPTAQVGDQDGQKRTAQNVPRRSGRPFRRYPLVPIEDRVRKPRLFWLAQLFNHIASQGVTKASARELARSAKIPFSTLTGPLAPVVCRLRRPNADRFFSIDFDKQPGGGAYRRQALFRFLKCCGTREILIASLEALTGASGQDIYRVVRYWSRRDPEFWAFLVVAVRKFVAFLGSILGTRLSLDGLSGDPDGDLVALWQVIVERSQNGIAATGTPPERCESDQRGSLPFELIQNS